MILPGATEVRPPQALAHEALRPYKRRARSLCGKTLSTSLVHPVRRCPSGRGLEQGAADAEAAPPGGDRHADPGDVRGARVRVADAAPRLPASSPPTTAVSRMLRGSAAEATMRRRQVRASTCPGSTSSVTSGSAATPSMSSRSARASRACAVRTRTSRPSLSVLAISPPSLATRRRPPTSRAAGRRAPRWRPAPRRAAPPAAGTASSSRSSSRRGGRT